MVSEEFMEVLGPYIPRFGSILLDENKKVTKTHLFEIASLIAVASTYVDLTEKVTSGIRKIAILAREAEDFTEYCHGVCGPDDFLWTLAVKNKNAQLLGLVLMEKIELLPDTNAWRQSMPTLLGFLERVNETD
eukprot:CAMPEP_0168535178 /NCGR_PEP_ID=MMETSP0405-20121227/18485_1 /TAXON_ID=498012 /ORGANISM="Trichosphaerium sp, Strain Am-I-7 wt" /LENGTH=132 /DNA_ID=CAMNT_0008562315 /DNA_START=352 /DNA_END=747 /DNA_ORIENTATION=+